MTLFQFCFLWLGLLLVTLAVEWLASRWILARFRRDMAKEHEVQERWYADWIERVRTQNRRLIEAEEMALRLAERCLEPDAVREEQQHTDSLPWYRGDTKH